MKKLIWIALFIIISVNTFGQTFRVQVGPAISNIDLTVKLPLEFLNKKEYTLKPDPFYGFNIFAGVDYMEREYFNLSSNFGYIRKGGKYNLHQIQIIKLLLPHQETFEGRLDYISFNTLFQPKYTFDDAITPYLSIGPRIDYMTSFELQPDDVDYDEIAEIGKLAYGLLIGGGINYHFGNWQFGGRFDYYLNFSKVVEEKFEYMKLEGDISTKDKVYTVNFSVGYSL